MLGEFGVTLFVRRKDVSWMASMLSLPPDASCCPHGDHAMPHTSCTAEARW